MDPDSTSKIFAIFDDFRTFSQHILQRFITADSLKTSGIMVAPHNNGCAGRLLVWSSFVQRLWRPPAEALSSPRSLLVEMHGLTHIVIWQYGVHAGM
jgi:hypothetical protein